MTGEKITNQLGKIIVPNYPIVPFIEGDGTGPDIWAASVRVLDAAVEKADFEPFHRLVDMLENAPEYEPSLSSFARPPRPEEVVSKTFCGT